MAENILGQKSGTSSSGPAGPATTALATFPTGGHKAERHIQGYMYMSKRTQIKKYRLGTVS